MTCLPWGYFDQLDEKPIIDLMAIPIFSKRPFKMLFQHRFVHSLNFKGAVRATFRFPWRFAKIESDHSGSVVTQTIRPTTVSTARRLGPKPQEVGSYLVPPFNREMLFPQ
jgi:hypothetical protein